jgi:hypothetical protein
MILGEKIQGRNERSCYDSNTCFCDMNSMASSVNKTVSCCIITGNDKIGFTCGTSNNLFLHTVRSLVVFKLFPKNTINNSHMFRWTMFLWKMFR